MTLGIGASVGRGGVNRTADVQLVQRLLLQQGCDPGGVDGVCGPRTVAAIEAFQRHFAPSPDGRVDLNGPTWRKLATGAATGHPAATPAGEWTGDSSKWPEEKKLRSLSPQLRPKVVAILSKLRARGFRPKIVFGWRSVAVQEQLFREGKTKVHFSFHNAQLPDGTPNAYAADIVDERWAWGPEAEANGFWRALGEEAKPLGLVWGGDWTTFKDVAHVQSRQNSELAAVKRESGL